MKVLVFGFCRLEAKGCGASGKVDKENKEENKEKAGSLENMNKETEETSNQEVISEKIEKEPEKEELPDIEALERHINGEDDFAFPEVEEV